MAIDLVLVNEEPPVFHPRDAVPDKGLYWVIHDRHRAPHICRLARSRFPECLVCGGKVRFQPVVFQPDGQAKELRSDRDFRMDPNPHIRRSQRGTRG